MVENEDTVVSFLFNILTGAALLLAGVTPVILLILAFGHWPVAVFAFLGILYLACIGAFVNGT